MPVEKAPSSPLPATFVPPAPWTRYHVNDGDDWDSVARNNGIAVRDLIYFNFHTNNPDEVNWYLRRNIGCNKATRDGKNWMFSRSANPGIIYIPPKTVAPPAPPPAPACTTIQLRGLILPLPVLALLDLAKVRLPSQARCLDPTEVTFARAYYSDSLNYDDIYMTEGLGAQSRPVTIALPTGSRWIVVLNMGPRAFQNPLATNEIKATLIHELAHAWQSQHYPANPMKFMWNCAMSQAEAELVSVSSNRWVQIGGKIGGIPLPSEEADAYAYVTGKPYYQYGGEQIAQQIEDAYFYATRLLYSDLALQRSESSQPPGSFLT